MTGIASKPTPPSGDGGARASAVTPKPRAAANRGSALRVDRRLKPNLRRPAPDLGPRAKRSIEKILSATKEVFLAKGYAGTSIDEITQLAGVSRASFYTYFPSKRDALLALAAKAMSDELRQMDALVALGTGWTVDALEGWALDQFDHLEKHGAFGFAWTQAARDDEELRKAGIKHHLWLCRRFGEVLGELRGVPFQNPTELGLLLFSMFERTWSFDALYGGAIDRSDLAHGAAVLLAARLQFDQPD